MSSPLSHSKDQPRIRKTTTDSSPTSLTARSLRHERLSRLSSSGSCDGSNDAPTNHAESYFKRRENRLSARKKAEEESANNDYKKARRPGECGSNVLETEKKESWSLKKRISDMEEQLKAKEDLKMENQRLKDENGALIRVITKLSK
ncbi:protein phosphatase 1 regulatory subunit 12B-like isoform X2 [Nelusetta ayraudi]|uniref:protein phosphatase 1 regulatory subunit 12B-like isoform X2 n=1 Tax=Nelusetta ayraudi TaxID=303726 RepID=UPI003F72BE99